MGYALFSSSSLEMLVNLDESWLIRSSTTATSSAELPSPLTGYGSRLAQTVVIHRSEIVERGWWVIGEARAAGGWRERNTRTELEDGASRSDMVVCEE